MNSDLARPINFSCPYCEHRKIETVATAPFVRGFVLAYQQGSRTFIGCTSCVRKRVLREAGLSSLLGWFSISAIIMNPFFIVYNLIQTPFIRTDFNKARKRLSDAGVPEDQSQLDITQLGYSLATSMMAVDGKIDSEEIAIAIKMGVNIFPDFSDVDFQAVVKGAKDLPPPQDIASILRETLTADGKKALCSYLWSIAMADGSMDESERRLLAEVAENIDFDLATLELQGIDRGYEKLT